MVGIRLQTVENLRNQASTGLLIVIMYQPTVLPDVVGVGFADGEVEHLARLPNGVTLATRPVVPSACLIVSPIFRCPAPTQFLLRSPWPSGAGLG
ncbi:hypothetical protein AMD26_018185 [Deinococcus sp. UR1]|nr:hypothetical protein AMD26_018185 [Deinococcus sp. UR1]